MAKNPKKSPASATLPDWDDDGTPITDMRALFKRMGHTSKQVERIADAVNETREEVIIVRTRQEDMGVRLERIESNGHPCKQETRIDTLEKDTSEQKDEQKKDAEARAKLEALDKSVEEVKIARSSLAKTVIGIIVSVILAGLGSGGSAIWYIRGLHSDLELESQARAHRDDVLDQKLGRLPTKQQIKQIDERLPAKSDVEKIANAVPEVSVEAPLEEELLHELWSGLSDRQKIRWCSSRRGRLPRKILLECTR